MTSLVASLEFAVTLKTAEVILDCSVGFAKNLSDCASWNLVSNQSEHGISEHIDCGLVAVLCIQLRHLLAGIAVRKNALGLCL